MSTSAQKSLHIEAVIFDHDGTLVDSEPTHHNAWQNTLADFDVSLTEQEYQQTLSGKPTIESAQNLVREHRLPIDAQTLCEKKLTRVRQYLEHHSFPLFDGVKALLADLSKASLQLAVASGAGGHEVGHSLATHSLGQYFEVIVTKDDVEHNKPAPDAYLRAAEQMNVLPMRCLAVEDSDSGQLAAIAAGMHCLRLDTFTRLPPHPRCSVIATISEVGAWLKQQN